MPQSLLLEFVDKLRTHSVSTEPIDNDNRQAAVSMIVTEVRSDLKILVIQRSLRTGDAWSGQMAFPGGHRDGTDTELIDTALRETREEVGCELHKNECVAKLNPQSPRHHQSPIIVTPFVFVRASTPTVTMNHEVRDYVWLSLKDLADSNRVQNQTVQFDCEETTVPGFQIAPDQFIWGLTFRLLQSLLEIVK